jgi:hypothetical protein
VTSGTSKATGPLSGGAFAPPDVLSALLLLAFSFWAGAFAPTARLIVSLPVPRTFAICRFDACGCNCLMRSAISFRSSAITRSDSEFSECRYAWLFYPDRIAYRLGTGVHRLLAFLFPGACLFRTVFPLSFA